MTVGGVDYGGRRVSFCVLDPDGSYRTYVDEWSDVEYAEHQILAHAAAWTHRLTDPRLTGVRHLVVESPIVGASKNAQTAVRMSMMAGALLSGVHPGVTVDLVPPATWKKEVVGRGNADKADVTDWLGKYDARFYSEALRHSTRRDGAPNQDVVDAICLALCAATRLAGHRSVSDGAA